MAKKTTADPKRTATYQTRTRYVEAAQFQGERKGVPGMCRDGECLLKHNGAPHAHPPTDRVATIVQDGDWVVTTEDGAVFVYSTDVFEGLYQKSTKEK